MYQVSQQKQMIELRFSDLVSVEFAASETTEALTRCRLEALETESMKPHPSGEARGGAQSLAGGAFLVYFNNKYNKVVLKIEYTPNCPNRWYVC